MGREREREREGERRLWTYRLWGSWVQRQADVALGLKLGVITRLTFLPTQLSLKAFDAWILYISFLLTSSFHVFLDRGFRLKVFLSHGAILYVTSGQGSPLQIDLI